MRRCVTRPEPITLLNLPVIALRISQNFAIIPVKISSSCLSIPQLSKTRSTAYNATIKLYAV